MTATHHNLPILERQKLVFKTKNKIKMNKTAHDSPPEWCNTMEFSATLNIGSCRCYNIEIINMHLWYLSAMLREMVNIFCALLPFFFSLKTSRLVIPEGGVSRKRLRHFGRVHVSGE